MDSTRSSSSGWLHGYHENPGRKASISAAAAKRQSLPPDAFRFTSQADVEAITRRGSQAQQRRASARPDMLLNRKASVTAELVGASSKSKSRKKSVSDDSGKKKRSFLGFGGSKKEHKDDGNSKVDPANSPSVLTRGLNGRNASMSQIPDYPNGKPDDGVFSISPPKDRDRRDSRIGSAIRRLSSTSKAGAPSDMPPAPRRILNIDTGREKCQVPELNSAKLRRVAFSVDVEIAGRSRYANPTQPEDISGEKTMKLKEQAEGAALKNPDLFKEVKESRENGVPPAEAGAVAATAAAATKHLSLSPEQANRKPSVSTANTEANRGPIDGRNSGSSPLTELDKTVGATDEVIQQVPLSNGTSENANQETFNSRPQSQIDMAVPVIAPKSKPQDRPTHDPLRIYRRCCQLREAPVLKRISEQLGNPASRSPESPEVVECLNLTRSRLQLQDFMCLGDWLAIVPVKKLILDDAHVDDERLRMVLCGLLAAKPPELLQRRRATQSRARLSDMRLHRSPGVIEKLVIKNNPKISSQGWCHLSVFLNLNKSIKVLDISTLSFPRPGPPAETNGASKPRSSISSSGSGDTNDMAELFTRALTSRLAGEDALEELTLTDCNLTLAQVELITKAATKIKLRGLGIAHNNLSAEAMRHVCEYVRSGSCRALDVGGNDLSDKLEMLTSVLTSASPLWALGLSHCNLQPKSVHPLWPSLIRLPDLRFLDLSHNQGLCAMQPTVLPCLRKYLPRMKMLKRLHLLDISMESPHATALAEILPECRNLAHLNLLENPGLKRLMNSKESHDQEEICALFTSLMTAVKLSKTLVCVDIDIPGKESSEVAKALARQVVAYCLRNMERFAAASAEKVSDTASAIPDISDLDVQAINKDLLFHIGEHTRFSEDQILDSNSANEDFVVGGTGLVKALRYFLEAPTHRRVSRELSKDQINLQGDSEAGKTKAKEVSKMLLNTARSVQSRLQPVIAREASGGDETALMRLKFLDQTLTGMIQRFEEEYPETRQPGPPVLPDPTSTGSDTNGYESESDLSQASSTRSAYNELDPSSTNTSSSHELEPFEMAIEDFYDAPLAGEPIRPSSRRGSNTSIASRHLENEEAQMHRFGQNFRRHVLPPKGTTDHLHGTSVADPEEPRHLAVLRRKLEAMSANELAQRVKKNGWEAVVHDFIHDAEKLKRMSHRDSAELRNFVFNQINSRNDDGSSALQELVRRQEFSSDQPSSSFQPKSV